ncbi:MAG: hypothetical protein ABL994_12195 [Verrucomicrobiales bacterium]
MKSQFPCSAYAAMLAATLLICIAVGTPAVAGIVPSFDLNHSVWRATDIVLATEGDVIDGNLRVLETWRGALEAGDEVQLPELAAFAPDTSRRLHPFIPEGTPGADATASGSTMILFLVRSEENTQLPIAWRPAGYFPESGFNISVAWVEDGETYALSQVINPGPLVMNKDLNALEIKVLVAASDVITSGLKDAILTQNAALAAQAIVACVSHGFHAGTDDAFRALEVMGETALPALRGLMDNGAVNHKHPAVIKTMAAAGGAQVAPDFVRLLEKQLKYWEYQAPKLERGWWNQAPADVRRGARELYSRTLAILQQLAPMNYAPGRDVTTRLRDFWVSTDSLQDMGDGQMLEAIDAVLAGLDATGVKSEPTG